MTRAPARVGGDWLTRAPTQAVMELISRSGHRVVFVGGCVRDALLGRPVGDVDIATDARPEEVLAIAEAAGMRALPTGVEHGTVTLVEGGVPHEVTTFRHDVDTNGRHAVVAFSDDLSEDARRRDLTLNALYAEVDGTVIDPLGALPDLEARRVRFVGEAEERIREDYLRILRFFRFHAHYADPAGGIDAEGLAAAAANVEGLRRLSRERIGSEMRRLLAAPDPAPAVAAMAAAGVLAAVLPGADPGPLGPLAALEERLGAAPDWRRRLALLGGEEPADAFRLSRAETRHARDLAAAAWGEAGTAELAWRRGPDFARDAELLRAARFGAPLPAGLAEAIAAGASARFPLRASDLPLEGRALGQALREAERRWIASGFRLTREELIDGAGGTG